MTDKEKYQGWTNRETWAAMLHLDNDRALYDQYMEMARDSIKNAPDSRQVKDKIWTPREAARFVLADRLKDFIENIKEQVRNVQATAGARMMILEIGSLWRVDWQEMADSILSDMAEFKSLSNRKPKK